MPKPRGDVEISSPTFYVPKNRRRCQTNQSSILQPLPLPKIGAYKIPHLQSQFPPNPTPTLLENPHPATHKSIDIPPI